MRFWGVCLLLRCKLMNLLTEMENFLEEFRVGNAREGVLDLYFRVRDFLNIYDILDENYVVYSELEPDGRFKVKLYCINPAANLQEYLEQGNSTIFFSATLLPIQYYKNLLSVEKEDYAVYAESSFPRENRLLLIGRDVSTRYTRGAGRCIEGLLLISGLQPYRKRETIWSFFRHTVLWKMSMTLFWRQSVMQT